jgi:hypothetical protein
MLVIPVNKVMDPKKNNRKKWRAKEEAERHKGLLTHKKTIGATRNNFRKLDRILVIRWEDDNKDSKLPVAKNDKSDSLRKQAISKSHSKFPIVSQKPMNHSRKSDKDQFLSEQVLHLLA